MQRSRLSGPFLDRPRRFMREWGLRRQGSYMPDTRVLQGADVGGIWRG